jgi:hypothetical protein
MELTGIIKIAADGFHSLFLKMMGRFGRVDTMDMEELGMGPIVQTKQHPFK